jgi:plasmid stabilization system protein ParE
MKVSIHSEAEEEITQAARTYSASDADVGIRFLDIVAANLAEIARNPKAYQQIDQRHRRKVIFGFPYSIFYSYTNGFIRVLAVTHQRWESNYWKNRS